MTKVTLEVSKDDNEMWTMKAKTIAQDVKMKFKLGQEFQEKRIDEKKAVSKMDLVGDDTWIHTQTGVADKIQVKNMYM